ncbi:MAG TPA: mechanosensitive ion channel family protein [Chryseosolibacter sp.]|nr:mechanosensitive ion channel family protein [Chryseosolibacter sp.]
MGLLPWVIGESTRKMKIWGNHWDYLVFGILVFGIAFIVGRILRVIIGLAVKAASRKLKIVDHTQFNFLKNSVEFIVYIIATIVFFNTIPELKVYGTALFAGAGVLAAIVGFASQSAFSNIVSGVFIVMFKPFSVGDRVKIGQLYQGDVEDITLRHTIIKDFENRRIVIPNSVMNNETIINSTLTDEKVCILIDINVSLSSDLDRAMAIIQDEAIKHPSCLDNRTPEEKSEDSSPVQVRLIMLSEAGQQIRGYAWALTPGDGFVMKCDLLKSIKARFDREHIQIAVPYRLVEMKEPISNPLAL